MSIAGTPTLPLALVGALNLLTLCALTVASAITWIALLSRRRAATSLWDSPKGEVPWGLADVWLIMLIWFAGSTFAGFLANRWPDNKAFATMVVGWMTLAATGIGVVWLAFRYRESALRWIVPRNWGREFRLGLIAFLAIVPPMLWLMGVLVQFFPYHHDTLDQITENPTLPIVAASYWSAVIAAPLGEEFFFRLVLLTWLMRWKFPDLSAHRMACIYGDDARQLSSSESAISSDTRGEEVRISIRTPYVPIILTSLVFAALHIGQGPAPAVLLMLGLALGALYTKTRSFLACVVLHAGLNAYSLTWQTWSSIEQFSR